MDEVQFREFGKAMIDYVADYCLTLRDRDVLPSVEPGYMKEMLPDEAPQEGESWQDIMKDVERVIMPGLTHWHSPNFHAFYPTANSYPGIVGEILSAGLGVIGFSWIASPACTELEVLTMDWLGKLVGLPKEFLNCDDGPGGGVLQGSASESMLVGLMAARNRTIRRLKSLYPAEWDESIIQTKLVAYSSDQSNSCVEKTGMLGSMKMRLLPTDNKCVLRGKTLLNAIEQDIRDGLVPCYVVATLGTTGTCAFDNLNEIGPVCSKYNVWLHIDAAYAGAAFVCPEYRYLMSGVEYADSYNFNCHKWLLTNFECSALWVKDSKNLIDTFQVDRIYLKHDNAGNLPDYRNWQIPLGRRFRSLKLWFVLRTYGVKGLQNYIRNTITLANHFADLVRMDNRFELYQEPIMGLVCFRLKGDNSLTDEVVKRLMARKRIYVIRAIVGDILVIRYAICSRFGREEDNLFAWIEIVGQANEVLRQNASIGTTKQEQKQDVTIPKAKEEDGEITSRLKSFEFDTLINKQSIC